MTTDPSQQEGLEEQRVRLIADLMSKIPEPVREIIRKQGAVRVGGPIYEIVTTQEGTSNANPS